MHGKAAFAALAAAALGASVAHAAVNVVTNTGAILERSQGADGKWTIRLRSTNSTAPTVFWIEATANDRIARVAVEADNPGQVTQLYIRGLNGQPLLQSVDLIERVQGTFQDVWISELTTTGDLGEIKGVTTVVNADIGGDITTRVALGIRLHGGEASIFNMRVRGNVMGNVLTPYGAIYNLTVDGSIGAPGAWRGVFTSWRLFNLKASSVYGQINTVNYDPNGWSGRIEISPGPFVGKIDTATFWTDDPQVVPGLYVSGECDAEIRIHNALNVAGSKIELPPMGLKKQLTINASGGNYRWNPIVPINVGGVTLTPTNVLTIDPSLVGGGMVAQAPYRARPGFCDPPHGSELRTPDERLVRSVVVRHDGPVTWDGSNGDFPAFVQKRPIGATFWSNQSLNFNYSLDASGRELTIAPKAGWGFDADHEWRVIPVRQGAGALRCADVAGNPLVGDLDEAALGYELKFTVRAGCGADFDGDGQTSASDLAALLGSWGPCGPGPCAADLNGDGSVNAADLAALLGSWGPCG